jgi:hypothetical protein
MVIFKFRGTGGRETAGDSMIDSARCIAIGSIDNRLILIPYEEKDNVITPVTIHKTDRKQINFRTRNGRFERQ